MHAEQLYGSYLLTGGEIRPAQKSKWCAGYHPSCFALFVIVVLIHQLSSFSQHLHQLYLPHWDLRSMGLIL